MGESKRRGSFEMRLFQAKARNAALEKKLPELLPPLRAIKERHGIQRLAVHLIMNGMMKRA